MARHYQCVLRFFELNASWVAEDLAQRTFLACIERADHVRDGGSFRGYLLGIARRQLAMHLRQLSRSSSLQRFDAPQRPAEQTRVSTLVARNREQLLALRALASLPRPAQALLILFYWEGVATPELAITFDVTPSTIRTRLARARDRLRDRMRTFSARGPVALDDAHLQQLLTSVLPQARAPFGPAVGASR